MRTPPTTRDWFALPVRARTGWVLLLGSMTALHAVTLDLYLPAFAQQRVDLDVSPGMVQLTLTGTLVGIAIGQLVAGPVSDALLRDGPDGTVLGLASWHTFASNTDPAPGIPLFMVADFHDTYSCDAAGSWRIAERVITPVFRNDVLAPHTPGASQ